jgi:hypothetical protein
LGFTLFFNDEFEQSQAGQTNWTQDCTDLDCPFAKTYAEMITLARTMGRKQQSAAGPEVRRKPALFVRFYV